MKGPMLFRRIGPIRDNLLLDNAPRIGRIIDEMAEVSIELSGEGHTSPYIRVRNTRDFEDVSFLAAVFNVDFKERNKEKDGVEYETYDIYVCTTEDVRRILSALLEKKALIEKRENAVLVLAFLKTKSLSKEKWTQKQVDLLVELRKLERGSKFNEKALRKKLALFLK